MVFTQEIMYLLPNVVTNDVRVKRSTSFIKNSNIVWWRTNPSGIRRGRKPYPLDADGNKIRPEKENKEPGQKQKKSK